MFDVLRAQVDEAASKMEGRASPTDTVTNIWPLMEKALATASTPYRRGMLVHVMVYHQRDGHKGCICGWNVLGASHPEHVADEYEQAVRDDPIADFMYGGLPRRRDGAERVEGEWT